MSITSGLEGRGRLILVKTPGCQWVGWGRAGAAAGRRQLPDGEALVGFWPLAAAFAAPEPGDPPQPRENAALGPLCLFRGKQKPFPRRCSSGSWFCAPLLRQPRAEPCGTRTSPRRASPSLQLSHGDLGPPRAGKLVALRVKNFTSSLGTSACSFPARSSSSPCFRCVRTPAPPRHQLFPCQISAGSRGDGITTKQRDFKRVPACFLFSPSSTTQYGRWQGRHRRARRRTLLAAMVGGRSNRGGGSKPPGFLQTAGKAFEANLAAWCCPPQLCLYFRALQYPALSGAEEGCVLGRDAWQSPLISCPFEVSQAGPPGRSPPRETLAWPRVGFLASAPVQSSDKQSSLRARVH